MRRYMPAPHAHFLAHLSSLPSLRTFAQAQPRSSPVSLAYNAAVAELSRFRDRHLRIVTRYIILPSKNPRKQPLGETSINLASVSLVKDTIEKTTREGEKNASDGAGITLELHGTGGTALMPFLKQTRDETKEAGLV